MTQGAGTWIGQAAVRPAAPDVLRLDRELLDWLRSVAGLPVRADAATTAADARADRLRLGERARARGYVEGDPPRLAAGLAPALLSLAAPSLVITAVQSSFGATGRLEIRSGEVPVLVGEGPGGEWEYEPRPELDLVDCLLGRLDLVGPYPVDAADGWTGVLPAAAYGRMRGTDEPDRLAERLGCPADLVRAAAGPVAEARVEIVRRAGAGLATGPTAVAVTEIAWVDGGAHGLWRVGTAELDLDGEPVAVELRRTGAGALAEELTRAVRDAEGC